MSTRDSPITSLEYLVEGFDPSRIRSYPQSSHCISISNVVPQDEASSERVSTIGANPDRNINTLPLG